MSLSDFAKYSLTRSVARSLRQLSYLYYKQYSDTMARPRLRFSYYTVYRMVLK